MKRNSKINVAQLDCSGAKEIVLFYLNWLRSSRDRLHSIEIEVTLLSYCTVLSNIEPKDEKSRLAENENMS